MSSKTSLVARLVVLSLLCDLMPASAAAAVASTSTARHRRQLPESAADQPTEDNEGQGRPSGSILWRAWLRAAAARAAADRLGSYDDDDDEGTVQWKRALDDDDIFLVRRRTAWNGDIDFDLLRGSSVSSSQRRNFSSRTAAMRHFVASFLCQYTLYAHDRFGTLRNFFFNIYTVSQ